MSTSMKNNVCAIAYRGLRRLVRMTGYRQCWSGCVVIEHVCFPLDSQPFTVAYEGEEYTRRRFAAGVG